MYRSLNLQQGNLCRTKAMLTSNNMAKCFKKSICDGNLEGVSYGICNKLTRMATALGLNDKFLIYPSDNRIVVF